MKIEIRHRPAIVLLLFLFFDVKLVADPAAKPIIRGAPIAPQPQHSLATGTNAPRGEPLASTPPAPAITNGQFVCTGFDKLAAFTFNAGADAPVSPENAAEISRQIMAQIPPAIKALNQKQVTIRGFMLPMKLEHGLVTEFLLLRNQMGCCYGIPPGVNEVIDVRTTGTGVPALMDDVITVYGTLHIAEVRENGYLTGIYKLDCERIQ